MEVNVLGTFGHFELHLEVDIASTMQIELFENISPISFANRRNIFFLMASERETHHLFARYNTQGHQTQSLFTNESNDV